MSKIYSAFFPGAFPPKCCTDLWPRFFNRFSGDCGAPIHHNAVMRAGDIEKPPQNHRAGQANQKRELEVDRLATIDTCRVTFITGDEPVKNEGANRAHPISK